MPTVEILDPLSIENWDDLVLATRSYSFFHSSSWAKVLAESYNYRPLYFTICDSGKIAGLLPIMEVKSRLTGCRGISLPFSDSCDPIASDINSFEELFDRLLDYAENSNWHYIELRGGEKFLNSNPPSIYSYNHTLDLNRSEEKIFSSFSKSTKRNIRIANKKGVHVTINNSFKALESFYRLNCLTRKSHGLPPQPYEFFNNLFKSIISKGLGVITLATINYKSIAGAIFFNFGNTAIYKYSAFDRKYRYFYPNNLIMWETIKYYNHMRFNLLDFGRTEIENRGLDHYKSRWGTQKQKVVYYRYNLRIKSFEEEKSDIYSKINSDIHSAYRTVFSKMPVCILKLAGAIAYRHMG
jgi:hypothetical protein